MKYYHDLDDVSLTLINFKKIFAPAQKKLLDDLHTIQKCESIDFKSTDVKRLFLHHVIYETCEEIINHKTKNKKVIIHRSLDADDTFEIIDYVSLTVLNEQLLKVINHIKKLLPIQVVVCPERLSFDTLKQKLEAKDGKTVELVYKILCQMQPSNMSFEKVKKFAKKNKLTFLSKQYFDLLRTKQLWL